MKKVLIAVGGTGGHLFPALALYQQLEKKKEEVQMLFAGAGLKNSPYFNSGELPFVEVRSGSPARPGIKNKFLAFKQIISGTRQAFKVINEFQPDLVVGFGSFHCVPLLVAAKLKGIPYALHEGNAYPGKVTRFFSKGAAFTAVQFHEAEKYLKGKVVEVSPLIREGFTRVFETKEEAREHFKLNPNLFTFLVFGGSQGAKQINELFLEVVHADLNLSQGSFQVLHLTGDPVIADAIKEEYSQLGISSYVKSFEQRMDLAYLAADLVISRAGASSLLEQLELEIPSILIPYEYAADDHQLYNAVFMTKEVGGAVMISHAEKTSEKLSNAIRTLVGGGRTSLVEMEMKLKQYKKGRRWKAFSTLVCDLLGINLR